MNQEAQEIYEFLWKAVSDVNSRWKISKQLFSSKDVVLTLNQSAPAAFNIFFWSLYDSIILGISRLTDRPAKNGRNHFTFLKLAESTKNLKIKQEVNKCKKDFQPIRNRRDQQKAHSDRKAPTMLLATRKEIDNAINALKNIMHVIEKELNQGYVDYDLVILNGDADILVKILRKNEVRRKRKVQGMGFLGSHNHNIDGDVYRLTSLKRDPNKSLVFRDSKTQINILDAIYELYGAVSECCDWE